MVVLAGIVSDSQPSSRKTRDSRSPNLCCASFLHGIALESARRARTNQLGLEGAIDKSFRRFVGKPPVRGQLRAFFQALYKFDSPHHERQHTRPQMVADIELATQLLDGTTPGGASLDHRCRVDKAGRLCCASADGAKEKVVVGIVNLLMGSAEAVPAEARWTHTLPNFSRTLVRQCLAGVGVAAFKGAVPDKAGEVQFADQDGDGSALSDHLVRLNGVRAQRVRAYLEQSDNISRLALLTVVLLVIDQLLYALMGGAERSQPAAKLVACLHRDTSVIGRVLSELASLLDDWLGEDPCRKPLCILEMLGCPIRDAEFANWCRGQILRAAAALSRRYERKYGSWPFRLVRLIDDTQWSGDERAEVAKEVLGSRRCCLDTLTEGVRRRFCTEADLLSSTARESLLFAFQGRRMTTDMSERQSAEMTASKPQRSPGRDFEHFRRHSVVKQCRVVHMHDRRIVARVCSDRSAGSRPFCARQEWITRLRMPRLGAVPPHRLSKIAEQMLAKLKDANLSMSRQRPSHSSPPPRPRTFGCASRSKSRCMASTWNLHRDRSLLVPVVGGSAR